MAAKAQGTWQVQEFVEDAAGLSPAAAATVGPLGVGTIPGPVGRLGAAPSVTQVDTVQAYAFGTRLLAKDIGSTGYGLAEFTYVKGVASVAVADGLAIVGDAVVRATTGGPVGRFALAVSALDAATKFGWVQTKGTGVATTGDVTNGNAVYSTSSAGSLDDAVVLGNGAIGAAFASDDDTSTALVSFPNGAFFAGSQAAS